MSISSSSSGEQLTAWVAFVHSVYCPNTETLLFQRNTMQGLEDEASHGPKPAQQFAATITGCLESSSPLKPLYQPCGSVASWALTHFRPLLETGGSTSLEIPSFFAEADVVRTIRMGLWWGEPEGGISQLWSEVDRWIDYFLVWLSLSLTPQRCKIFISISNGLKLNNCLFDYEEINKCS